MGHTLDPSTGKPTFNNSPSTVSDLQAASDYTAQIGEASVATVSALEDIEYPRKGEQRYVEADASTYIYNGTGWDQGGGTASRQIDTTNDTVRVVTKYGFGKITGSGTTAMAEAVTFDSAFGSVPHVDVNFLGIRATGVFNLSGLTAASAVPSAGEQPTTTGFQAYMYGAAGAFSAAFDWYYSWVAVGEAP